MLKNESMAIAAACIVAQFLYQPAFAVSESQEKKTWGKRIGSALRVDKKLKGIASYYGGKFHGRKTASGDTFNQNEMTCAHKTLPFGTKLEVTNPSNGKEVEVVVNDRGPFIKNRVLDLSKGAARKLGITGIAKVFFKPKTKVSKVETPETH